MSEAKSTRHILSKSTFIRGCQCVKSLYLYKHFYKTRDPLSPQQRAIFNRGTNVGVLARELFPGGRDASPPTPFQFARSVTVTREHVDAGVGVIYEAAFSHERVLAAMDILVRVDGDEGSERPRYRAYEVKSSTGISDTYLLDAALQYWVITGSGIELEDISIVHIDSSYVRRGALEIGKLFRAESVLAEVLERQGFVGERVEELKAVVVEPEVPAVEIGPHCTSPYPCDFMGTCWRGVPDYSVFDIARLAEEKKFTLYRRGVVEVAEVPEDFPLTDSQRLQVDVERTGTPKIDVGAIAGFLDELVYPLYFIDFESFQPAVPLYEGTRPYQQIPFQFSLHVADSPDSLRHEEFLAEPGTDPRLPFLEALLALIGTRGSVLVYNRSFEETRLTDLSEGYPQFEAQVAALQGRIFDLMRPFRDHSYYSAAMRGSYSIKRVLPALVPELSYAALRIQDGTQASIAFERLGGETDRRTVWRIRRELLEYCRMDTYAMVKILEALGAVAGRRLVSDSEAG